MTFSINTNSSFSRAIPGSTSAPSPVALTEDNKTLVADTLAQFDPQNLSQADAASLVETFSEAGIAPGKELAQLMADAGFDAREVGELAGVEPRGQNQVTPPQLDISSVLDYMETALANKNGQSLSDDEKQALYKGLLEEFNLQAGDSLINIKV